MTNDEKLQVKKDTLWDIHETKQTIACYERKIESGLEGMKSVLKVWEKKNIGAVNEFLVFGNPPTTIKSYLSYSELAEMVAKLSEAKDKLESLEKDFDRIR